MKVKELIERLSKFDPDMEVGVPDNIDAGDWSAVRTVEILAPDGEDEFFYDENSKSVEKEFVAILPFE